MKLFFFKACIPKAAALYSGLNSPLKKACTTSMFNFSDFEPDWSNMSKIYFDASSFDLFLGVGTGFITGYGYYSFLKNLFFCSFGVSGIVIFKSFFYFFVGLEIGLGFLLKVFYNCSTLILKSFFTRAKFSLKLDFFFINKLY